MTAPELAYVEHALPGAPAERLALARRLGLGLEVACRAETDLAAIAASGVEVVTVQAWKMHYVHPLHVAPTIRARASRVVEEAMDAAVQLGAPRVLTVCGFGHELADAPFERCVEFFSALGSRARERGLHLLIELLSPRRAAAMTEPDQVQQLLDELGATDVFTTAHDTGHLLDAGLDPVEVLRSWRHPVEELQLRGSGSHAPGPDDPLERWLAAAPETLEVAAIEHRDPLQPEAVQALVQRVRTALTSAPRN